MKHRKNKTIYLLSVEDAQTVALEEIKRELTPSELNLVIEEIEKRMPWHDLIADSINEVLSVKTS